VDDRPRLRLGHTSRSDEVPLGECSSGSTLQVPLEQDCTVLVRELDGRDEMPGAIAGCVDRPSGIVRVDAAGHIGRQPGVIAPRIASAAKHIDETLADSHGRLGRASTSPRQKPGNPASVSQKRMEPSSPSPVGTR
jgi:hypothetical protein